MASGRNLVTLLYVWGVVCMLISGDVVSAALDSQRRRETGAIDSTTELYYLRGSGTTTTFPARVSTQDAADDLEDSFEEFVRRELQEYGSNPAVPNCDNDPTLCP